MSEPVKNDCETIFGNAVSASELAEAAQTGIMDLEEFTGALSSQTETSCASDHHGSSLELAQATGVRSGARKVKSSTHFPDSIGRSKLTTRDVCSRFPFLQSYFFPDN